jgi:hypothetical protein
MNLTLNPEDARTLHEIIHDYLPDLRREAAGTDLAARDLRNELTRRETLCERLLADLERDMGMAGQDRAGQAKAGTA